MYDCVWRKLIQSGVLMIVIVRTFCVVWIVGGALLALLGLWFLPAADHGYHHIHFAYGLGTVLSPLIGLVGMWMLKSPFSRVKWSPDRVILFGQVAICGWFLHTAFILYLWAAGGGGYFSAVLFLLVFSVALVSSERWRNEATTLFLSLIMTAQFCLYVYFLFMFALGLSKGGNPNDPPLQETYVLSGCSLILHVAWLALLSRYEKVSA